MNLFTRLSDIMSGNVNALLDRVENPDVMLAQIVREMEAGLVVARGHAATTIAAVHRLSRELDANRTAINHWKNKARDALRAGREDLARLALVRKREHEELVDRLQPQHAEVQRTSEQVRSSLRTLEARLAEARHKQRALVARHHAVIACRAVHRLGAERFPWPDATAGKFARWENRLGHLEDELRAQVEIDNVLSGELAELSDLTDLREIDRELEELRRELSTS